jgi:hypothetical protein
MPRAPKREPWAAGAPAGREAAAGLAAFGAGAGVWVRWIGWAMPGAVCVGGGAE